MTFSPSIKSKALELTTINDIDGLLITFSESVNEVISIFVINDTTITEYSYIAKKVLKNDVVLLENTNINNSAQVTYVKGATRLLMIDVGNVNDFLGFYVKTNKAINSYHWYSDENLQNRLSYVYCGDINDVVGF